MSSINSLFTSQYRGLAAIIAFAVLAGCNSELVSPQIDIQQFDLELESYYNFLQLPGLAVGVAQGDSLVFFRGLGYANVQEATQITENHIFWIASLTKTFSAVSLKQWEEQGKISLKDSIRAYPNNYFNDQRITAGMTIEHLISHTSESDPIGKLFIYNGGRYNVIFNVFDEISSVEDSTDLIRPFTQTIDEYILKPLHLNHTLTRLSDERAQSLEPFIVTPYSFRSDSGTYVENKEGLNFNTSFPSTGMLSSVSDLVRYSNALDEGRLISKQSYNNLTTPYYKGPKDHSPYGLGWFTTHFEGVDIHWGYGYGAADASLILKVPAEKLTLVALSNAAMPSGSVRMGNGNPLNSIIAVSFLKYFVFNEKHPISRIDFLGDMERIESYLREATDQSESNLYLEEAYSYAMMMQNVPDVIFEDSGRAAELLMHIHRIAPEFINPDRVDAFELLASFDQLEILSIGSELAEQYERDGAYHPLKSFYSGLIAEKLGDLNRAKRFYEQVATTDAFVEQPVKYDACMWLGKYYRNKDNSKARHYLESLLKYKDLVGGYDDMYEEAKAILDEIP